MKERGKRKTRRSEGGRERERERKTIQHIQRFGKRVRGKREEERKEKEWKERQEACERTAVQE